MLRKTISIILITTFVFNASGYFICFYFSRILIKYEIKEKIIKQLPDNQLFKISFRISSDDFKKLKWFDSNEFSYKGKMYDIVRKYCNNDGIVTFFCFADEEEETLLEGLDLMIEKEFQNKYKQIHKITVNIIPDLFFNYLKLSINSFPIDFLFPDQDNHVFVIYLPVLYPPPKLF